MPSYRLGEAAMALGVSTDTLRRWMDTGRVTGHRTSGGQRVIDGEALAALAVTLAPADPPAAAGTPRSARNRIPGVVTKVSRDGVMAQVEIQAGPHRIVSLLTREAADELGLAPGVLAVASIKATSVVVERMP
ncbi:MAG: TOBE domain-containing protein [Acidimicrobiales bacterium]